MQQQQEQSRSSGHRPTCVLPRPRRDHHARSLMLRCLERFTRSELIKLKERNQRVLRLRTVVNTLPDKGDKLRKSIRLIDTMLKDDTLLDDHITPDNTFADSESPMTLKFNELSLLTPVQQARRRTIASANATASFTRTETRSLSLPTTTNQARTLESQVKVCMISLDESVQLQEDRERLLRETRMKQAMEMSLDETLSMRMGRMHLGSLDTQPMDPAPCYIAEDQDDSTSSSSSCNNNDDDGYLTRSSSDHTDSDEMDEYHQLYTDDEDDDDDGDNAFFRQNRSRRRR